MRVEVSPRRLLATPGQPLVVTVSVTNTGEVISGHVVRVLGADPRWVSIDNERLSLFPGSTDTTTVTLQLPAGLPAGEHRIAIQVRELTPPESTAVVEVDLDVPPARAVELRLDPVTVTGGRTVSYGLVVANNGNTPVDAQLAGSDEEERIAFRFDPPRLRLGPGEHAAVEARLRARRRLTGMPVIRPFAVRLDDGSDPEVQPAARATFVQKPVLSRGALSLGGLLAAITVFAIVITVALSGVVGRSAADRDLALQVAQARNQTGSTGTASIAGTVRLLTTSAPVPGVTVELFNASDVANPLTSTATDAQGVYHLANLADGSYKLRFRGAGFAELWYPGSLTDSDATTVTLQPGQDRTGLDVRLGGLPATVSGTVTGDDVTGATVTIAVPGSPADSGAGGTVSTPTAGQDTATGTTAQGSDPTLDAAVLRSVKVAADGVFSIDQVPSPSVYDVIVSKPGYATETQRIDVGGGEDRSGIVIALRKGDGLIAGHVTGASGPLGGATVTATYGQTTVRTVSLTQDDVGAFTLRGLPTPAQFTVVVSKPGLASQTLSLSLSAGQQLTGVGVTLGGASGSLSGTVTTLADGRPAGGVSVTVTNGALTVQTVTQSTGNVGAWNVGGLTVPSTYTVTFSRDDLASQTVSVSLNAFGAATAGAGGMVSSTGVDAALRSATAVLRGQATQGGAPAGEVTIQVASSTATYTVTTASVPSAVVGRYEIDRLPPGTYTVSVSRHGTRPTSTIVTLAAGQVVDYNPALAAPASVQGVVRDSHGNPLAGAQVSLYLAEQYPTVVARTTTTGADGSYSFSDVDAPEHYVVEAYYPPGGAAIASSTFTLAASESHTENLTDSRQPAATP